MKDVSTNMFTEKIPEILPVIPTMDVVVFPNMIVPLLVLDERIIKGIDQAVNESKMVMLLATKKHIDSHNTAIGTQDLYDVGTVASVMRIIKVPEGGVKILVQGMCKAHVKDIITSEEFLHVSIEQFIDIHDQKDPELLAQIKNIKELAERMNAEGQTFSPDFHLILSKMQDPDKIADFVLSHLNLTVEDSQELLEKENHKDFLEGV